jgi:hypothetical protein
MPLPQPIAESFFDQATACLNLGSPFNALVCRLLAERLELLGLFGRKIHDWEGDPKNDALPLRATGGLHALARSGRCLDLSAAYPPHGSHADVLWAAIEAAIGAHDQFLCDYLGSPPQTNEVARSNAILGGCLVAAAISRCPLEIYEIGSSAGLNLGFDRYEYELGVARWGDPQASVHIASRWEGDPPSLDAPLEVVARAGCDVQPLDPSSPPDRERLLSYIWPDQAERLARTAAALDVAARAGRRVERADAADWVEAKFGAPAASGRTRLLLHTIVWQYMPPRTRERIQATMQAASEWATPKSPVAWLSVEPDGIAGSAAVRLTLWPPGTLLKLGRADYHGRWTRWERSA